MIFIGSRRDGGFAEYIVVKRNNVFALPADMPIEDGAFIEPITVGLHAFHLAQGCENKNVIILVPEPLACWQFSALSRWEQRV